MNIQTDLIDFYDNLVDDWFNYKTNIVKDPFLSQSKKGKNLLTPKYFNCMPEPYYGNPDNNLIVTINLNPGFSDGDPVNLSRDNMKTIISGEYSVYAKSFPYITNTGLSRFGGSY